MNHENKKDPRSGKTLDKYSVFIIIIAIIILLNVLLSGFGIRLDLTKNHIYSLSSSSRKIIKRLEEPLTVKVFFSENLPAPYSTYRRYLEDILREYRASGKHFRFEFIDPGKKADEAANYGINPMQIQVYEKDEVQFKKAYMGMVFIHGDMIERIPQITSTEGLEYRITSLIRKMNKKVDLLAGLQDDIQVILFATSTIPISGIPDLNEQMKDKLDQLSAKYFGKLKYTYVDTSVSQEMETLASNSGLHMLSWPAMRDVPAGSGYIGIVVRHGSKSEMLNILGRNIFGQYVLEDIDSIADPLEGVIDSILGLKRKIGYITGTGEPSLTPSYQGMPGQSSDQESAANLASFIRTEYELQEIPIADEEIPQDVDALIVLGPTEPFSEQDLYKIDQFVMSGKPAAFILSKMQVMKPSADPQTYGQQPRQIVPLNTGLERLLKTWGIELHADMVFDKNCYKQRMTAQYGGGERELYYAPIAGMENISKKHPITQNIKGMIILQSSSISPIDHILKKHHAVFTPLVKTSKISWSEGQGSMLDYVTVPTEKSNFRKYTVAGVVKGSFESSFKDRPLPFLDGSQQQPGKGNVFGDKHPDFTSSVPENSLLVIGSEQFALNALIDKEGKYPNSIFMRNVVDWLVSDSDLMSIRSKGLEFNPMKQSSEAVKNIIKVINLILAPILVILFGILLWRSDIVRRKKISVRFGRKGNLQ